MFPYYIDKINEKMREKLPIFSEKSDTKYLTPEGKSVNKAIVDSVTKPNTNIQKEMGQIETNDELRAYEQAWRKQLRKENPKASEKELEKMVFDAVSEGMFGEATRLPEGFVPEKLKFLMPKNKNK